MVLQKKFSRYFLGKILAFLSNLSCFLLWKYAFFVVQAIIFVRFSWIFPYFSAIFSIKKILQSVKQRELTFHQEIESWQACKLTSVRRIQCKRISDAELTIIFRKAQQAEASTQSTQSLIQ